MTGEPPLLWGQQHYWYTHQVRPDRDSSKIPTAWALPAGVSAGQVRDAVAGLVRRHESLRTTFPLGSDGQPVQRVHEPGPVELPVVAGTDPHDVPRVMAELAAVPMDPRVDRPMRCAVLSEGGVPRRLVAVFNHVAVDGLSMEILWRDFVALLTDPGAADAGPARSPRELAAGARSAPQQRHARQALAYWERCLRAGPRAPLPGYRSLAAAGGTGGLTYRKAELVDDDLDGAVERVARRHRVLPSMVYLTAYSVFVSLLSANPATLLYCSFANRGAELDGMVGCLFQRSPLSVTLPDDLPFGTAAERVRDAYLTAWEHAPFPYFDAREVQARVGGERGADLRLGLGFNYYESDRVSDVWYVGPPAQPGRVSWIEPGKRDDESDLRFDVLRSRGRTTLTLLAHRSVLDEDAAHRLLVGLARLVADWAADASVSTATLATVAERYQIAVPRHGSTWRYVDHGWVHLPAVEAVLRGLSDVDDVDVFEVGGPEGGRHLLACVASRTGIGPARLRAELLAETRRRGDVLAPRRFVVCREAPAERTVAGWLAAGPAPDVAPPAPEPALEALRRAVARYRTGPVDPALSYVDGGGTAGHAAAVLADLAGFGWTGLTVDDLLTPLPLSALTGQLSPAPGAAAVVSGAGLRSWR